MCVTLLALLVYEGCHVVFWPCSLRHMTAPRFLCRRQGFMGFALSLRDAELSSNLLAGWLAVAGGWLHTCVGVCLPWLTCLQGAAALLADS